MHTNIGISDLVKLSRKKSMIFHSLLPELK